jgi:mannose-6-phosphate isomerase-like protein (cupin superfamily)
MTFVGIAWKAESGFRRENVAGAEENFMLTFIDTNKLPRKETAAGEVTEVLNSDLCGAKNVVAALRWLKPGEHFKAEASDRHQLLYLMEGQGTIRLDDKDYDVSKGAGVYLGPSESATIRPATTASLKLFHLVVPRIPV